MSQVTNLNTGGGGGGGTITSISAGEGITLTPNPIIATGSVALTVPVVIADGGTNAMAMVNTDGIVYFDGTRLVTTTVGTATQILTSNGAGFAPSFQNAAALPVIVATSYVTDSGTAVPAANVINFKAYNAANHDGASVTFSGAGSTILLNLQDAIGNIFLGSGAGNITLTGADNVAVGAGGILSHLTTGTFNNAIGADALLIVTSGQKNNIMGTFAADELTTGQDNTVMGHEALGQCVTGSDNLCLGDSAGFHYTGAESSNIMLANDGVLGESNTMRFGQTGGGAGFVNRCFIAGTYGVNVGSVATLVSMSAGEQIGTTVITAGSGIAITPGANTITIDASGAGILPYTNVAVTPYTVLNTDLYLSVDTSALAITVRLENAPGVGEVWIVKDRTGNAVVNNITVTTVGGAVLIDGATTFVMNTNYESIQVLFNGTSYEVY